MKESMRVHPGVGDPLERYVPAGGAEICGYHLPEGTVVSVSAPVVHQSRSIFGLDAPSFRPERWLEASPEQLILMDRAFVAVSKLCHLFKEFRRLMSGNSSVMVQEPALARMSPLWKWANLFRRYSGSLTLNGRLQRLNGQHTRLGSGSKKTCMSNSSRGAQRLRISIIRPTYIKLIIHYLFAANAVLSK